VNLKELRDEIDLQLASIQQSASVVKSDEVVDDDQVDSIVTSARKIALAFNAYLEAGRPNRAAEPVDVPEELEPSPYQEGNEGDDE